MRNAVKLTCPKCGADSPQPHRWTQLTRLNFRCPQCETCFSVSKLRPNLFGDYDQQLEVKLWTKPEPFRERPVNETLQQAPAESAAITYDPVEPAWAAQLSPDREVWDSKPTSTTQHRTPSNVRDTHHPLQWFCTNWDQYMTLVRLKTELQMDGNAALNLLRREGIEVLRLRLTELRSRYFIPRELAETVIRKHGTPAAIAARRARYLAGRHPVNAQCPGCGAYGKHWRAGFCSDGKRILECCQCRKRHTVNSTSRPPLQSTCIHCGATTRQQRRFVTMQAQLSVKCAHCKKVYSIPWQPDPSRPEENEAIQRRLRERHLPIDSQCPFCSRTGRKWRRHIQLSGELKIQCGHCRRHYTLTYDAPVLPSSPIAEALWHPPMEQW